jgi:hypothetical protein
MRGRAVGPDAYSPPHHCQSAHKGPVARRIGRTKGGLNSKLHAVCDGDGKPLILLLTEGQVSDYRGAATILRTLPDAKVLIADRGLEARLVSRGFGRPRHRTRHSRPGEPQSPDPL